VAVGRARAAEDDMATPEVTISGARDARARMVTRRERTCMESPERRTTECGWC
jgi:hypothetical protein